jgi:hypothetical protein
MKQRTFAHRTGAVWMLVLMLFISSIAQAQSWTDLPNYGYRWNRGQFKIALRVPFGSTPAFNSTGDSTGAIYFNTTDSSIYVNTGHQWIQLGGAGGATYSAGYGLLLSSNTFRVDTNLISTRLWRQKGIDSINTYVSANYYTKTNINSILGGTTIVGGYNKTNWDAVHAAWSTALASGGWVTVNRFIDSLDAHWDAIQALVSGGGIGDMVKSTYDTDNDGVVDNTELFNGVLPSYYFARANHTGTQLSSTISDWTTGIHTVGDARYVPLTRTITINGTTYDLSANRSWTVTATTPTIQQVLTAGNNYVISGSLNPLIIETTVNTAPAQVITNNSTSNNGLSVYNNASSGNGIYLENASSSTGLFVANYNTSGIGLTIDNGNSAGNAFTLQKLGINKFYITRDGLAKYSANYGSLFDSRTLVDKGYVDSVAAAVGSGSQDLQSVATEGNTTTLGLNASSFGVLSSDTLRAIVGYSFDGNFNKYGYLVLRPKTDLTSGGSADGGMFYVKSDKRPYYYHDDVGEIDLGGSGSSDSFLPMDLSDMVSLQTPLFPKIIGADTSIVAVLPDATPTASSTNLVTSGGVYAALAAKQATLISGTNIKTINSTSLLGSGDISISGVSDGDKTDITVSSTGSVFTIDNNAVTTAKINALAVTDAKINDVAASKITGTIAQARLGTGSGGAGTKVLADDQTYKDALVFAPTDVANGDALIYQDGVIVNQTPTPSIQLIEWDFEATDGQTTFINSDLSGKHVRVWRDGRIQRASTTYGIAFSGTTITFYPALEENETVYVEASNSNVWTAGTVTSAFFSTTDGTLFNTANVWTSNGDASFGHLGLNSKKLAAGDDGRIYFRYTATDGGQTFLGFNTTNALTGFADMEIGLWLRTFEAIPYVAYVENGTFTNLTSETLTVGYYYGISRTGSTIKIQKSADAVTWTDLATSSFSSSADLFVVGDFYGQGKMYTPIGTNLSE